MEPLAGISHEDLLKVVLSFSVLLASARLLGELARRLDLPEVVGEISAGIVLGPSLLSGAFPALGRLLLPTSTTQSQLLDLLALIGVMFLLIVVGLETDLSLIRARAKTAMAVGLMGLIVPFAAGVAISSAFPDELLVQPERRGVFALFLAVALALSAIPVLAKILGDLGLIKSPFGQTALAAGMLDDILGWTLLGVVTSLAAAGGVNALNLLTTVGGLALFLAATAFVASPFVKWGVRLVRDHLTIRDASLTFLIVAAFLWGALSHALHLEPILGAFAIAIVFGRLRQLPVEVGRRVESMTFAVFAPVFLAIAGLRLSLSSIWRRDLLVLTAVLVLVAAASKIAGAFVGARIAGIEPRESLAYGVALNARGVLGIVVASIGLSMGILGVEVYSMIVVVSILTSLVTPLGLRALLPQMSEVAADASLHLESPRRVLMTVRPDTGSDPSTTSATRSLEAAVLSTLGSRSPEVTLLAVGRPDASVQGQLDELSARFPDNVEVVTRMRDGDPSRVIVAEAEKGYDFVVMGAPRHSSSGHLFGSVVDDVVRMAPCPTLIFNARDGSWPPTKIMVPTGGSLASERAARLAFELAEGVAEVLIYHVIDQELSTELSAARPLALDDRREIGEGIVGALQKQGLDAGIHVSAEVAIGTEPLTRMIAGRAARDVDLIVLGTSLRIGTPRLFMGPKVERLLEEAPCSMIVVNS